MAIAHKSSTTGVSFALTDEQRDLQALAHEFAEKEIRPSRGRARRAPDAPGRDREGACARADERAHPRGARRARPLDLRRDAHRRGALLGLRGNRGLDRGEHARRRRRSSSRARTSRSASGSPPLLEEPILCSFALTEPNAGSDVSGIQTTAVRDGDDYVINGSKMFITNAGHASWIVVFASTDKSKGHRGAVRVRRPGRRRRRHGREAPRQDGPARDGHVRRRLPGRQGAGREPARRGGRGLQDRDADARPHAARARRSEPSASPGPRTSTPSSTRGSASSSASRSR